jgi:hypothetical protein
MVGVEHVIVFQEAQEYRHRLGTAELSKQLGRMGRRPPMVGLIIGKSCFEDGDEIGHDGTASGQDLRLQRLWQRVVDRTESLHQVRYRYGSLTVG